MQPCMTTFPPPIDHMPQLATRLHETKRVVTFSVVTLVVALVLNLYGETPWNPVQLMWLVFGAMIGVVEQFFFTGRMARLPVFAQLILRVLVIWLIGVLLLSLLVLIDWIPPAFRIVGINTVGELWTHPVMFQLSINALIIAAAVILFMEMERMVGTQMFRRFLLGRYVHPQREDRVVMFIDLADSTTHTEKLGDRRYFEMLNETFDRMTGPILHSDAELLKYVGDELILTWMARGDARDARCIELFFAIRHAIEHDREHYQRTYGMVPLFRAGCHRGVVITAQIGTIKRSIDMSGDAMNTCARLAGITKELRCDLVVSEDLLADVGDGTKAYKLGAPTPAGLRGKAEALLVRTVEEGPGPR